ncbi:protein of unknown function [Ruminococcus sp. YE71]|uniref:carbohydrate-binding domain-containing protein n=1 Tax=unclassified Ruminococcus TaxID=2608920 RepID=UPI00087F7D83|nr:MULTISPECIES: carbohydrate-binding domain-containing protein [unclassified Ruminococcus]SDA18292.1 protein of unknown function [Ruminococcus sp. YE78]SFW30164.1 protein of unknown function [Ruminococcus sp. YE71]
MKARITKKAISAAAAATLILTQTGVMSALAYDEDTADNVFTFTDTGISASDTDGEGFDISGTELTISAAGTYVVTGECAEGSITVKKGTEGVVLVLSDIRLTSSETSPLKIGKEASAEIVIEGENTLTDAEDPANEDSADETAAADFEGAAVKIKSNANVVFSGSGTLTADGSACKNGIKGGEGADITVSEGVTLNVKAVNNALSSDGSVTVNGGTLDLTADGDGLKSSPDEDDETSEAVVNINGGDITISAGDDGIVADGELNITGGNISVTSADDAIHLNGTDGGESLNILGGNITINAGDDGIHSDYLLNIGSGDGNGPTIVVENSYEGFEGAVVNLNGGSGSIRSTDDGVNAANGDLTGYSFELNITGGEWYINADGDGLDSNGDINISGGYTEVFGSSMGDNAALDYGDFNCNFNVTGGTVIGVGMSQMATSPTSGKYITFGAGGMGGGNPGGGQPGDGQEPPTKPDSDDSGFGGQEPPTKPDGDDSGFGGQEPPTKPDGDDSGFGGQEPPTKPDGGDNGFGGQGGTAITLNDGDSFEIKVADGNVLYSGKAVKSANHIVFSSEALEEGVTYYLYINGEQAAETTVGAAANLGAPPTDGQTVSTESTESSSADSSSADGTSASTSTSASASAAAATGTASASAGSSDPNPSTGSAEGIAFAALGLAAAAAVIVRKRR